MAEISFFRLFGVQCKLICATFNCLRALCLVMFGSVAGGGSIRQVGTVLLFHFIFFFSILLHCDLRFHQYHFEWHRHMCHCIRSTFITLAYDRKPVTRQHFAFKAIKNSNKFTFPSIDASLPEQRTTHTHTHNSQHCSFPLNAISVNLFCCHSKLLRCSVRGHLTSSSCLTN